MKDEKRGISQYFLTKGRRLLLHFVLIFNFILHPSSFILPFILPFILHPSSFILSLEVDLREPSYAEGVLTTCKGGVVCDSGLRVQAMKIVYTQQKELHTIVAEDCLLIEYQDWIFTGSKFEYDFETKEGVIFDATGGKEAWYFGGKTIELHADGSYSLYEAFVTTSENRDEADWQIKAPCIEISKHHLLSATHPHFRFIDLPVLWLPSYHINLNTNWALPPLHYHMRIFGRQGPLIGLSYDILSWKGWTGSLLLDYSFKRGFGGGCEIEYDQNERSIFMRNYIADDTARDNPTVHNRYRFSGCYEECLPDANIELNLTYDKLSDKYMATDYYPDSIDSKKIEPTLFVARKRHEDWIATLETHLRANTYQTVKEELPTLTVNVRPYRLLTTGIISDSRTKLSYLNFLYDDTLTSVTDFHSGRLEIEERLYRPFTSHAFVFTPEASLNIIHYTQTPSFGTTSQVVGQVGYQINGRISRTCDTCKHIAEPYLQHQYFHASKQPIHDYYVFDIDDGWDSLQVLRFGLLNHVYIKSCEEIRKTFFTDLYAYAFFARDEIPSAIPRLYLDAYCFPGSNLKYTSNFTWDTIHNQLESTSLRADYTYNEQLAFAAEYRHRSDFSWRKVDKENFFLDNFQSVAALRASSLSDRRDTFLTRFSWRMTPRLTWVAQTRFGWNRRLQPNYREYQIDCHTQIRNTLKVKVSFQHREDDSRITLSFSLLEEPCLFSERSLISNY